MKYRRAVRSDCSEALSCHLPHREIPKFRFRVFKNKVTEDILLQAATRVRSWRDVRSGVPSRRRALVDSLHGGHEGM